MKLLGWMHRKSKHISTESLKTCSTDNSAYFTQSSFDELSQHAEPNFSYACSNMKGQNYSTDTKANRAREIFQEESFNEVFQGFLAIGTLGVEPPLIIEAPTPTFPEVCEQMNGEETEITENDLKLIHNKLEKFLEAEAEEAANRTSERSSNASIVTICNNQIEDAKAEDSGNTLTCPLQNYLFGSSVKHPKTELEMKKEKASLGELFKKSTVDEHLEKNYENKEKQPKEKCVAHFMKKMLKKLHSTSRTSKAPSNGDADHSALTKRKFPKALKVFHRKVHPEELTADKNVHMSCTSKIKKMFWSGYQEGEGEGETTLPRTANPTKEINSSELSLNRINSVASTASREQWIKTDAKYLVLEL